MSRIKWRNKMSGEEGYVAGINFKEGHIISANHFEEANVYSERSAKGLITKMEKLGMEQQNEYCLE